MVGPTTTNNGRSVTGVRHSFQFQTWNSEHGERTTHTNTDSRTQARKFDVNLNVCVYMYTQFIWVGTDT